MEEPSQIVPAESRNNDSADQPAGDSDVKWQLEVKVDPVEPDDARGHVPDGKSFSVDLDGLTLLIGRRSNSRSIFPEISLEDDDAVSHRHAQLNRTSPDTWVILDLGSTNGTRINQEPLTPNVPHAVTPEDLIHVGGRSHLRLKKIS